jgi:hypothetical protein
VAHICSPRPRRATLPKSLGEPAAHHAVGLHLLHEAQCNRGSLKALQRVENRRYLGPASRFPKLVICGAVLRFARHPRVALAAHATVTALSSRTGTLMSASAAR